MDSKLDSKELFRALVDVLDYGLYHDLVEEAELVLAALRAMRPRMLELDTFEAFLDHAVDGVSATTADAHDFHAGVLCCALLEFEDHCERDSTTAKMSNRSPWGITAMDCNGEAL